MDRLLETLEQKTSVTQQQPAVADQQTDLPAEVETTPAVEETSVEDSFDKDYEELLQLVSNNPTSVPEGEVPKEEATVESPEGEMPRGDSKPADEFDYKSLYETETEKRISFESEARQRELEAKYWREKFENEWDKYYSNIDRVKELESELRVANTKVAPEAVAPIVSSYNTWKETQSEAHKYVLLKDIMSLAEEITAVPATEYYEAVLRAGTKDVPDLTNVRSDTTATVPVGGDERPLIFL